VLAKPHIITVLCHDTLFVRISLFLKRILFSLARSWGANASSTIDLSMFASIWTRSWVQQAKVSRTHVWLLFVEFIAAHETNARALPGTKIEICSSIRRQRCYDDKPHVQRDCNCASAKTSAGTEYRKDTFQTYHSHVKMSKLDCFTSTPSPVFLLHLLPPRI